MKTLTLYQLNDTDELASPTIDNRISVDSPATEVFTDFVRHTPLVIDSSITAAEAKAMMKRTHVRLKFVINDNGHFVGIVSRDDLHAQGIMKKQALQNTHRDDLMVTDFMKPRAELKVFHYQDLCDVTIDELIEALKFYGEQHCLVVDNETHKIRGIISSSDIARKLHLDIDIHERSSFLKIFEAVHH